MRRFRLRYFVMVAPTVHVCTFAIMRIWPMIRLLAATLRLKGGGARKYFIAGNWKLNPTTLEEAKNLASAVSFVTTSAAVSLLNSIHQANNCFASSCHEAHDTHQYISLTLPRRSSSPRSQTSVTKSPVSAAPTHSWRLCRTSSRVVRYL
jgi:hypothetical protein